MTDTDYRPCVAITLFNDDGQVLVAERNDVDEPCWQLPQGGIDAGETPAEAAFREMAEEIGTGSAVMLEEATTWVTYDWPENVDRTPGKGRYRGQRVKPVALRFTGDDDEIDLNTAHPEFRAWRWVELNEIPALIVDFKRPLYDAIVEAFGSLADVRGTRG